MNAFLNDERLTGRKPTPYFPPSSGPLTPPPVEPVDGRMTLHGVTEATGILAALLMIGAVIGWGLVKTAPDGLVVFPSWVLGALIGGFVLLAITWVKPGLAKFVAPPYALIEGLVVGSISRVYEAQFEGIVMQASLATIGIFLAMLAIFTTGAIKVTDNFRRIIAAATMAIMFMYAVQLVSRLFGSSFQIPFLHDSGPIGIGISLVIIVIAAFNYLLDFDMIQRGIAAGAPRDRRWVAALGLLVTTIWVYFEVLRLLAKLRD